MQFLNERLIGFFEAFGMKIIDDVNGELTIWTPIEEIDRAFQLANDIRADFGIEIKIYVIPFENQFNNLCSEYLEEIFL